MTCFENFRQSTAYMQAQKTYKAAHMSETFDNAGWVYANVGDAIKKTLKQQNKGNGIANRIETENLDTVLLQKNA